MGFTKLELVQFFDGLTELVSEENRGKARVQIRKFLLSFEKAINMRMQSCTAVCHICRLTI